VAHVAKYTASASGQLCQHYERKKNEQGEYIRFGNQDIDLSRTQLNYNIAPEREQGQVAFIRQRCSEVRCQKRADVNVMCSWIVTLPKNIDFYSAEAHSRQAEAAEVFFERSYRFMAGRYGEENVVSAYVHMDEKMPHMHFAFVPVVADRRRGGTKVSAKEAITKRELQVFHSELAQHLEKYNDFRYEVLNDATKDGNKSIAELKRSTAAQELRAEIDALHQSHAKGSKMLSEVLDRMEAAKSTERALQGKIEGLQSIYSGAVLTEKQINEIKIAKPMFGDKTIISDVDFENLKKTAMIGAVANHNAKVYRKKYEESEKAGDRVWKDYEKMMDELDAVKKQLPSILEKMKQESYVRKLTEENATLKNALNCLPDDIRQRLFPQKSMELDFDLEL